MNYKKVIFVLAVLSILFVLPPLQTRVQAMGNACVDNSQCGPTETCYNLSCINSGTVNNLAPTITSISPSSLATGGSAFTLTVNGSGFQTGDRVYFGYSSVPTTVVSSTQITASVTAWSLTTQGTINVLVYRPSTYTNSNIVPFAVTAIVNNNPVPTITSILPTSSPAGSASFTLTVNGTNFINGSIIECSTVGATYQQTTTYVSPTQLTAVMPPGYCNVVVYNPTPGGGPSNAIELTSTANNPTPNIMMINTTTADITNSTTVGDPGFTLRVYGTGFISSSIIRFNGQDRATTLIADHLEAFVPASLLATTGNKPVTVFNPTPGGGVSNAVNFTVNNPVPIITSITPDSTFVGNQDPVTVTVNGSGFVPSSTFFGSNFNLGPTSYISPTQISVVVPASRMVVGGSIALRVINPVPGGGSSNYVFFIVGGASLGVVTNQVGGSAAVYYNVTGPNYFNQPVPPALSFIGNEISSINPGTAYSVNATIPSGWTLVSSSCRLQNGNGALTGSTSLNGVSGVAIVVGQTTICTFNYTKNNPDLTVTMANPDEVQIGSPNTIVTISGTNFKSNSYVSLAGTENLYVTLAPPNIISSTQLTVTIPALYLVSERNLILRVKNPPSTNPLYAGETSDPLAFDVVENNSVNNSPLVVTPIVSPSTGIINPSMSTSTQDKIASLMQQIAELQRQLALMNSVVPPAKVNPPIANVPSIITPSVENSEIRRLQVFLNNNGFVIAAAGPGSPGNETDILGPLTKQALINFQAANGLPKDSSVSGEFGPWTRAIIKEKYGGL